MTAPLARLSVPQPDAADAPPSIKSYLRLGAYEAGEEANRTVTGTPVPATAAAREGMLIETSGAFLARAGVGAVSVTDGLEVTVTGDAWVNVPSGTFIQVAKGLSFSGHGTAKTVAASAGTVAFDAGKKIHLKSDSKVSVTTPANGTFTNTKEGHGVEIVGVCQGIAYGYEWKIHLGIKCKVYAVLTFSLSPVFIKNMAGDTKLSLLDTKLAYRSISSYLGKAENKGFFDTVRGWFAGFHTANVSKSEAKDTAEKVAAVDEAFQIALDNYQSKVAQLENDIEFLAWLVA